MQRNSTVFFFATVVGMVLTLLMFLDATLLRKNDRELLKERSEIVRVLTLTDLCLFTDARYTRHPSMTDLHAPFQDHPLSFEHFPTGSLMGVPQHLTFSRELAGNGNN